MKCAVAWIVTFKPSQPPICEITQRGTLETSQVLLNSERAFEQIWAAATLVSIFYPVPSNSIMICLEKPQRWEGARLCAVNFHVCTAWELPICKAKYVKQLACTSTLERVRSCIDCGFSIIPATNLRNHTTRHTGDKPSIVEFWVISKTVKKEDEPRGRPGIITRQVRRTLSLVAARAQARLLLDAEIWSLLELTNYLIFDSPHSCPFHNL